LRGDNAAINRDGGSIMKRRALLMALAASALGLSALHAGAGDPPAYKIGDRIADFALKDEAGKTVHLSQYKGKVVVLNFYGFN
jgi:cytochrome oxidase Cu insertion factor (SCO1/SenC/PrrC family)